MNKTSVAIALAAIFSVGLGTPLWAAPSSADTDSQSTAPASQTEMNRLENSAVQQQPTYMSTTAAINPKDYNGKEVITAEGDTVGKVDRLVINNNDHAVYAVIGVGGILGMGEKDSVVPINRLQSQDDKLKLSAGITQDSLKSGMMYEQSEFSAFEPMMDTSPTE